MSSSDTPPILVWFRQDLRLGDNPALAAAAATGQPIIPVYILDDTTPGKWKIGGASRWWLNYSLERLGVALEGLGSQLILKSGPADEVVSDLVSQTGAAGIYWNRCYEPHSRDRDVGLKEKLKSDGRDVKSFNASLLNEPWEIENGAGKPFRVFTPYWRKARTELNSGEPIPAPRRLAPPLGWPQSDALESWDLRPSAPDWASTFHGHHDPGEAGANVRLEEFLDDRAIEYADGRDRPDQDNTSGLSAHLHFGEISPRQILRAVDLFRDDIGDRNAEKFLSEIGWREFSYSLLSSFPDFPERNHQSKFDDFPWRRSHADLTAWKYGKTGYPFVDAGMRELWATGIMHNRVRMVTASFLIKHLLIDWREGQNWFWDTLVDADLANNSASWQWVAGSGADASPFFRIFNPVAQAEKFDPHGEYVRKWVPEIARLPDKFLNRPWDADEAALASAKVKLGTTYPAPIVDHKFARERALSAFKALP
ncbi:MAG: deoxyribodipyrimidine photo-lyase [Hyphobacterium sp.]|nr:MAG: deoxyribodipyrimidine photo-lyase [Hyphobacterium sp.]